MTAQPGPEACAANYALGTGKSPEYVVEAWVSAQLRDRTQRNKAPGGEPSQEADMHITHRQTRAPQPDLEAEP
jgi:hypothetical protein